jgi:Cu2+-exporting ATPase/Cu+-exporting ATPase
MLGAEYGVLGIQEMPEAFHYVATRWLLPLVATFVIFTIGRKYLRAVWTYVTRGKATMDTLVGIGTGFAYLYSMFITLFGIGLLLDLVQYVPVSTFQLALSAWLEKFSRGISQYLDTSRVFYEAVIIVIGFISIGKYMEQRTMSKTGQAIKALLNLQVKKARKLVIDVANVSNKTIPSPLSCSSDFTGFQKNEHYTEQLVDIEHVQKGDLLLVKPGEKIPLDGIIRSGTAHLDESMITGESLPVSKTEGETVIGSTLLLDSPLVIETIATGNETYLSKIIAVVEQAQHSKPQIQYKVDNIMKIFIPVVLSIAVIATVSWLLIGIYWTSLLTAEVIRYALQAFVGVLVIACPCGLGLATPMAIITGMGHAAKNGILAKNADGLIKLRKVKFVAFDKTGTLTEGKPTLVEGVLRSSRDER